MCAMAKPKTVKSDVKTKVESPYVISFSVGGDTYTAEGATILEALQKIKPKKYLGICKVEAMRDGKKSRVPLKLVPYASLPSRRTDYASVRQQIARRLRRAAGRQAGGLYEERAASPVHSCSDRGRAARDDSSRADSAGHAHSAQRHSQPRRTRDRHRAGPG